MSGRAAAASGTRVGRASSWSCRESGSTSTPLSDIARTREREVDSGPSVNEKRRFRLGRLPVAPSCVLSSGGGLVVWWLFDKPLESEGNRKELQRLLKLWEKLVRMESALLILDTRTADLSEFLGSQFRNAKYGVEVDFLRPQLSGSFVNRLLQMRGICSPIFARTEFSGQLPEVSGTFDNEANRQSAECSDEDRRDRCRSTGATQSKTSGRILRLGEGRTLSR
jgi:hypothetical protein